MTPTELSKEITKVMDGRQTHEQVAKYIIDKWLDKGVPLTEIIEAFLRETERATYEKAAMIAEKYDSWDVAGDIREAKPRPFVFKNRTFPGKKEK